MSRAWPVDDLEPDAPLDVNARRILAVKMAEFYSYAPAVPVESATESLHDLRIAAKRLRYSLELFRSVFGDRGEAQIDRVKALQEELGAIHDHDVRIALIEDELAAAGAREAATISASLAGTRREGHSAIAAAALRPPPDDPRRGLIALLGRQHVARHEHYEAFRELWDRYAAEGMRADLAALSSSPLVSSSAPSNNGTVPASRGRS